MSQSCPTPLHEECLQHHVHKGDPGVTPETCDAIGKGAQVIIVWVRALGIGNASTHETRIHEGKGREL